MCLFIGEKNGNIEKTRETYERSRSMGKDFNAGQGPAQTMDNLNWLVGQTRMLGDRLSTNRKSSYGMQMLSTECRDCKQFHRRK